MDNPIIEVSREQLELVNEKLQRNEKILIQAFKSLKEKELKLKQVNEELQASEEELKQSNELLYSANELLISQKEELEITLNKLKETQMQLVQSEKMASVGILTAGVAHELNNPLNFIQGGKTAIENYISSNIKQYTNNLTPLLEIIQTGIDRAAQIVQSLNHFSRSSNSKTEICNIHLIIDNCLIMLQNKLKNKVKIAKQYTSKSYTHFGNTGKLHQVFLNVLTNAEQSIEEQGIIIITTAIELEFLVIQIQDSGNGISKENINKILDPFFTTKEPGKGTGLGLSIVYSIIKEHNGEISFKSELNKGTLVTIKLPINNYKYEQ
jgi:signal transduction histidine kinase